MNKDIEILDELLKNALSEKHKIQILLTYNSDNIISHKRYFDVIDKYMTSRCVVGSVILNKINKYSGFPYDIVNFILRSEPYIKDEDKKEIVNFILKKYTHISYSHRKKIKDFIVNNSNTTNGIEVVKKLKTLLNIDDINKIINRFPDRHHNKDLTLALKNNSIFICSEFTQDNVYKDPKIRKKFIKAIADKPTILNNIKFTTSISEDDLKNLSPIKRFNFIRNYFHPSILPLNYNKSVFPGIQDTRLMDKILINNVRNLYEGDWRSKIYIGIGSTETMKELLFAASLHKNEEVKKWFDLYSRYMEIKTKYKPQLVNMISNL